LVPFGVERGEITTEVKRKSSWGGGVVGREERFKSKLNLA